MLKMFTNVSLASMFSEQFGSIFVYP